MAKRVKNAAAVQLGKMRAKTLTREHQQMAGEAGGRSRARKLTPAQRKEIAAKGAAARWGGKGKK
jgi:hypothetical protein